MSLNRDGWLCSVYEPGTLYDGSEGELYDMRSDPHQWNNLWHDPNHRRWREDLKNDLYSHRPKAREARLPVEALV